MKQPNVHFQWIRGLTYQDVWNLQTSLHKQLVDRKLQKREWSEDQKVIKDQDHQLIFCEHSPVFTLGKSGSMDHLLLNEKELAQGNIEFFKINRGGDITYHGPGQITGYPIFDLDEFFTDVHKYVRLIEEAIIDVLLMYNLKGERIPKYTGVWLPPDGNDSRYRKICAIGVHLSRWVSMHGFAFNINTDLSFFEKIIPCGIVDENMSVTSLSKELGREVALEEVGERLLHVFADLFHFKVK